MSNLSRYLVGHLQNAFTNLFDAINKISQICPHSETFLLVILPAVRTFSIFGVTVANVLPAVALSIKLNGKVFVPCVLGHSCALVYCQLHSCPNDPISEISIVYWQGSIISIVVITSKWLKAWHRFWKKELRAMGSGVTGINMF